MTPTPISSIQAEQVHFLKELLHSLPTPVFYKDINGIYIGCNQAFALFLGIDRESIIGKSVYEVSPPELAKVYEAADRELMARGGMQVYEAEVQGADGIFRDVIFYKATISDPQGKVCGLVGTILDISERKRSELALAKSRQELELRVQERTAELLASNRQLLRENREKEVAERALRDENAFNRAIIDTVAEGLCVCHNCAEYPYVRFTVWNRRMTEITGYTMQEINRLGWYQTVYPDPDLREKAVERMERMREGDDLVREEWTITTAGGSTRVLEIYSSILRTQGEQVHVLAVMQDVTDRKRDLEMLREALAESNALQVELLASHEELRTLSAHLESVRESERKEMAREVHDELGQSLTGLRLDLAWLARRSTKCAPETIAKIRDMGRTVNSSIQSVQRITSQLRPRVLDDLGLAAAVEWQVQEFRKRAGARCILSVQEDMPEPAPHVATALFRILQEAFTNVIRHSHASEVTVSLSCTGGVLVLEVTDNGRGIGDSELKSSRSYGIIGIRERAHLCAGNVTLQGEPGKGTSLTVNIPMSGQEGTL